MGFGLVCLLFAQCFLNLTITTFSERSEGLFFFKRPAVPDCFHLGRVGAPYENEGKSKYKGILNVCLSWKI